MLLSFYLLSSHGLRFRALSILNLSFLLIYTAKLLIAPQSLILADDYLFSK